MSGRDGFINGVKALRTAFPDWTVSISAMIAERDLVCDHVSIRATHSGQAGGTAPTHQTVTGEAMHLWRLSNSRLVEGWYYATPEVILKVFAALSAPTPR